MEDNTKNTFEQRRKEFLEKLSKDDINYIDRVEKRIMQHFIEI